MSIRKVLTPLAIALLTMTFILLGGLPANAATDKNGILENGELGLYYGVNQGVHVFDLYYPDKNFAGDVFPNTGVQANDNTVSYWNRDTYWWHVFTNANYTGSHGCVPPMYWGNTSPTFTNSISSAYWSSSSC